MNRFHVLALVMLAATASACKGTVDSPTRPTGVSFTSAYFTDVIDDGGSRIFTFTVNTAGPVVFTLASATDANTGAPLGRPMRLSAGRPDENGCVADTTATVQPALVSQLTYLATAGSACLEVADATGANVPVRFVVRFTHP